MLPTVPEGLTRWPPQKRDLVQNYEVNGLQQGNTSIFTKYAKSVQNCLLLKS